MIDLNPYFQKKLGETLEWPCSDTNEIFHMEIIAVSESPNSVSLEVESRSQSVTGHHMSCKYHGVVEVDLNRVRSVRSALETAYKTILTRER